MENLLLLHGALATKEQFNPLLPLLDEKFKLHRLTFLGHGNERVNKPVRMQQLVDQVVGFLDERHITKTNIFGYSMGGYVGLALAKKYPNRIHKIATLGTILQWNEQVAQKEGRLLNPGKMEEKIPAFVHHLDKQHPNGWKKVVKNTREMLHELGQNPLITETEWKQINTPVQLLIGDRDSTAGLASNAKIYKQLPDAQLGVLPNTPHPFKKVNKGILCELLVDYFEWVSY